MFVGLSLADVTGVVSMPTWFRVVGLPVIGAVIWRLGGASLVAIASWVIPLGALLYVGFWVISPPLDALVLALGVIWFGAMIMSSRLTEAWYRAFRLH